MYSQGGIVSVCFFRLSACVEVHYIGVVNIPRLTRFHLIPLASENQIVVPSATWVGPIPALSGATPTVTMHESTWSEGGVSWTEGSTTNI